VGGTDEERERGVEGEREFAKEILCPHDAAKQVPQQRALWNAGRSHVEMM
jgi:hypothetical protein